MQTNEPLISPLQSPPSDDTDAWRVLHDVGAGIWIDHFDGRWLVQTKEGRLPDRVVGLSEGVARSIYWRPRDKAASTAPELVGGESVGEPFLVREHGVFYRIDFSAGYSSGIFLDQRLNRRSVRRWCCSGAGRAAIPGASRDSIR